MEPGPDPHEQAGSGGLGRHQRHWRKGNWLKLVATAGLQWDKAILQYLVDGNHLVERKAEPFWGGVTLSLNRPRPPKPPKKDDRDESKGPQE